MDERELVTKHMEDNITPYYKNIIRNSGSNYASIGINLAITFIMLPYVIRKLGVERYGIWVLLMSMTGYLQMVDFGLTGSLKRYVAKFWAEEDIESINHVLSISAIFYMLLCSVIFALICLISLYLKNFNIPTEYLAESQACLILLGIDVTLILMFSLIDGLIWGMQRFDLTNYCYIIVLCIRTIVFIGLLEKGYGIVELAIANLGTNFMYHCSKVIITVKIFPRFRLRFLLPTSEDYRTFGKYSIITFFIGIFTLAERYTPNIIIGFFMAPVFISYFSVANNLDQYLESGINAVVGVMLPIVSSFHSKNNDTIIKEILLKTTKYLAYFSVYGSTSLILFGDFFLTQWIGFEFAKHTFPVVVLLAAGSILSFPQNVNNSIFLGTNHENHALKFISLRAIIAIGVGAALCYSNGIIGFTVAIFLSRAIVHLGVYPWFIKKVFKINITEYFFSTILYPCISGAVAAVPIYLTIKLAGISNYNQMAIYLLAFTVLFIIALFYLGINSEEKIKLKKYLNKVLKERQPG
jgi:O-antigen/teichoic acid export membrane protein